MKELVCIVCPKGCRLRVEGPDSITGNSCPRGADYGKMELTHPTRVVTSTVRCTGGLHPRCPVKTDRPIPKELMLEAMEALAAVDLTTPVRTGQVVLANLCGTGANVVATRDL